MLPWQLSQAIKRLAFGKPTRSVPMLLDAGLAHSAASLFCDNFVQNGEDGTSGNLLSS